MLRGISLMANKAIIFTALADRTKVIITCSELVKKLSHSSFSCHLAIPVRYSSGANKHQIVARNCHSKPRSADEIDYLSPVNT